ncbi:hypothetical protein BRC89_09940 [Halobacteriales archaeon QS_4_70_19]|nr:MAG: hypothetical protein BRC89_09940 [Halobacteriales archaeon QS_4_70_19]
MVPTPLQSFGGGLLLFRLFGLLFAGIGALNLVRLREMTAYRIRRRPGEVDGTIEPSWTRLLFARLMGGVGVVIGLGLASGLFGP